MRKFLLSAMFLSASLAIGQAVNFSELKVANTTPSNEQLTGQTLRAHSLMKKAARRVVCVQQSNSEIPADKAEVILEAHKVFGEFAQLGFQLLLDADHSVYGEYIYDWSQGYYDSYDYFEYKIPTNADASETTTNVILDGEEAIQIPAGVYDFIVLYPCPGDGLILAKGDFSNFDDFEFKGGCSYRFLVEYAEYDNDGFVGYFPVVQLYTEVDAALTSITLPANGMELTNSEDITVEIVNRGSQPISQFTVSYQINEGDVVNEVYTSELASQEKVSYTFTTKADMSEEKQYEVKAWVTLEGDMIANNNTVSAKCKHIGVSQLPYICDFSTAGAEVLESDWSVLDVNADGNTWQYNEWQAGADGEYGVVSCTGCWMGDCISNDYLVSVPLYFNAGDNHIIFNTRCINEMTTELLDVLYGSSSDVTTMTTLAEYGVATTDWVKKVINFTVPTEGVYYIAFRNRSVDGMNLFIDEVIVGAGEFEVSPMLRVDKVILPYSNCDLSDQSVIGAMLTNIGTGATETFTLTYKVGDNASVSETFTAALQPTETATYYFETRADFSEIGSYEVLVEAACKTEVESSLSAVVNNYEPYTQLPINVNFSTGENYDLYWTEMNPGTWELDEMFGRFGTEVSGIENGLLSRCFECSNPLRLKIQYANGGWEPAGITIAYGKAGADVSTYTVIYEKRPIETSDEVEIVIPIAEKDHYSILIASTSDEYGTLYLGEMTLSELLANDLRLCSVEAPMSMYTPQSQLEGDIVFVAEINNRGTEPMTGVKASLMLDGETIATSEPLSSIAMDETVFVPVKATLTRPTVGDVLQFAMSVTSDIQDAYEGDNIYTLAKVNVTDTLYASEGVETIEDATGQYGEGLYIGNVYELSVADVLSSVTLGWGDVYDESEPVVTDKVGLAVYRLNDDMTIDRQLYLTEFERGLGGFVTYRVDPIKMQPGKYYIEVQQLCSNNMGIGASISPENYCYQNVDGVLTKVSGAGLIIRANFGHDAVAYDKDVAVVSMVTPVKKSTLFSSSETIQARVKNMGAIDAAFSVVCKVNEVEVTKELQLLPYETCVVDFGAFDLSATGDYLVTITASLDGDENPNNDTYTATLVSVEEADRYVMDFENCYDFDAAPDVFNPKWRTVDRVGEPTDYYWMFEHPYRGEPVGFMAFNINATKPVITEENLPGFYPHAGERFGAVFCVGYESYTSFSDAWLISPQLTLGTNSTLELYVKTRMLENMDFAEEPYRIWISTTDDNFDSFTIVGDSVRQAPVEEWGLVTVDLSAYDKKDVYVAIQYIGERFKNVCLMVDDIAIKGDGLGSVDAVDNGEVVMRYNVAEQVVTINAADEVMQRVELYNVQGQLLFADKVNGRDLYRLSVADCVAGVYIVKVYTTTGCATYKFVVR